MERRHTTARADPALRAARLAELVAELTGTEATAALHAVRSRADAGGDGDALGVVAEAMVEVEQPVPPRLRPTGYLREPDATPH